MRLDNPNAVMDGTGGDGLIRDNKRSGHLGKGTEHPDWDIYKQHSDAHVFLISRNRLKVRMGTRARTTRSVTHMWLSRHQRLAPASSL